MAGPRRRNPDLRVLHGARGADAAGSRGQDPSAEVTRADVVRATALRDSAPDLGATALVLQELSQLQDEERDTELRPGFVSTERAAQSPMSGRVPMTRATFEHLGDAQLVALTRAGDRVAFETLYRRHAAFALNLAVRIQGRLGDAEDVVHDAFLRAHNLLDRLRDDGAFRGWLGSIVVSLVRTRLRRVRFLGALGLTGAEPIDLDALAADSVGPETRALLAQLYGVLRRMPVDQRIAWTLRYVERHSLPDVASMAGCSLATAKRRIAAAQAELDRVLSDGSAREEPASAEGGAIAFGEAAFEEGGDDV
jgi:RNA polymerase sigma-70 factor (ECF subfamily)